MDKTTRRFRDISATLAELNIARPSTTFSPDMLVLQVSMCYALALCLRTKPRASRRLSVSGHSSSNATPLDLYSTCPPTWPRGCPVTRLADSSSHPHDLHRIPGCRHSLLPPRLNSAPNFLDYKPHSHDFGLPSAPRLPRKHWSNPSNNNSTNNLLTATPLLPSAKPYASPEFLQKPSSEACEAEGRCFRVSVTRRLVLPHPAASDP